LIKCSLVRNISAVGATIVMIEKEIITLTKSASFLCDNFLLFKNTVIKKIKQDINIQLPNSP
ncbi:hypothetical protein, partial [Vibrio parahaemolyticus]|uniref:hypothetical protein n=1 Tax=Vibrio parahaemolyticus TaxID=670 RepID=UPI001C5E86ED